MSKPKDTDRIKVFEVRVQFTDVVLGRDKEDALTEYKKWLNEHTKGWKILDVYEVKEPAW